MGESCTLGKDEGNDLVRRRPVHLRPAPAHRPEGKPLRPGRPGEHQRHLARRGAGLRGGGAAEHHGAGRRDRRGARALEQRRARTDRRPGRASSAAIPRCGSLVDLVERVAPSSAAVTILGESGTGKELVARAIHARSPHAERPFIPVNCAAISKELIESELFGHEKGAFTGRHRHAQGRLRGGRRRHALPRRGGRAALRAAGQAAPRAGVGGDQAGRLEPPPARRRPGGGGHQPRSARRHPGRAVPRRPLLPALRGPDDAAPAAEPPGRHRGAGRALPPPVLPPRPDGGAGRRRRGAAGGPPLAGQRARAPKRGAPRAPPAPGHHHRAGRPLLRSRSPAGTRQRGGGRPGSSSPGSAWRRCWSGRSGRSSRPRCGASTTTASGWRGSSGVARSTLFKRLKDWGMTRHDEAPPPAPSP